jgi:predicted phage terminase large subunit-like protein
MPETLDPETGDLIGRDLLHIHDLDEFLKELETMMLAPENKHVLWGFESVAFQKVIFKEFQKKPKLAMVAMIPVTPDRDKVSRARPVSLRSRNGHFKLVRAPWNAKAIRELIQFPKGTHDDIVDTVSGGNQMISEAATLADNHITISVNPFYSS